MTKKQIETKKEELQNEINKFDEEYIPNLETKKEKIEDKANERESGENTEKEQGKIEKIEEQISLLEEIKDALIEAYKKYEELEETLEERMEILKQLQKAFKDNVWRPDLITKVDSDPRYRAITLIEKELGITIEWDWEETDFTKIGSEPIVIEFTSTKDDAIKITKGTTMIKNMIVNKNYRVIKGDNLIILIESVNS